jgi:sugar phosphate isomerase/epimerase
MRGDDPHHMLDALGGKLSLARVRDARAGSASESGQEVRLGEGDLDVPGFLAALDEAGLSGDLIISRNDSARPVDELRAAREVIERYL